MDRGVMAMSEEQIKKIMNELGKQNKVLEGLVQQQREMKETLEPIAKIYSDMTGFNTIAITAIKGLLLLSASIGVVYGFIKYLKT